MKTKLKFLLATLLLGWCSLTTQAQVATEAWVQRYNPEADAADAAQKVATDASGNVIVAGYTSTGITGDDWVIIKYTGAGAVLWANRYNGPGSGDDRASAVAVDGSGNVFVSGYSAGSGTGSDYAMVAYSGAGVPLWTNRYNGPGNGADQANAVAVDGSGNVFVSGYSTGSGTGQDYATVAYSGAGVPLWTNRYNGPGNSADQANAVVVDGSGNIYVTGNSLGSGSSYDYATVAYSGAGAPLWTNRYNGPVNGIDRANGLAVNTNGNVYVTGASTGGSLYSDYATVAYSGAGVALWTNRYSGPGSGGGSEASAVAVDASGSVFVTGYSWGSGSYADYATVAYSDAGVPLWTNRYQQVAGGTDRAIAVVVDGTGNVLVAGSSSGSGTGYDYATVAYSGAGVPLWTNRYNGPGNFYDQANAVAVDGSGNVFVTGYVVVSGPNTDFATVAYSGAGVPLWTNRYNGPGRSSDRASAVVVDGSENVFVSGYSAGSGTGDDYATVGYSGGGLPLWTNRYNGPGNGGDQANALAVNASGTVFVTGYSVGSVTGNDYATVAYSGVGVPLWTNRYNGPGSSDDQASAVAVNGSGKVFVTGYSSGSVGYYDYATLAYSEAGVPLWTNRYTSPGNNHDYANAVAVSGSGNVFVTGYSDSDAIGTDYDYATVAYSGVGVPLWTNRFNGGTGHSTDQANAVAVDGSGNVFVTGFSYNATNYDYVTVAYLTNGVPLWTNRYNGPGNSDDRANAVAVDGSGNVFVTGSSGENVSDYATVAYSGAGVPLWTNRYNGPGNGGDYANAVVVDGSGNIFVSGYSGGSGTGDDYATVAYSGAGVSLWTNRYNGPANGHDQVNSKYSIAASPDGVVVAGYSDGDSGPGTSYDYAVVKYTTAPPAIAPTITSQPQSVTNSVGSTAMFSVSVSGEPAPALQWRLNGNPIPGATNNSYTIPSVVFTNAGDYDVVASNTSGSVTSSVATLTFLKGNSTVAVTGATQFYFTGTPLGPNTANVTGSSGAVTFNYSGTGGTVYGPSAVAPTASGTYTVTATVAADDNYNGAVSSPLAFEILSATSGTEAWVRHYSAETNANDYALKMVADGDGNVIVAGRTSAGVTGDDWVIIKYSGTGVPLWTNCYKGPNGYDEARAMAVDQSGNVYVTGASIGNGSSVDYTTIAYSGAGAPLWTNRYNGPGNDSDYVQAVAVDGSGNVYVTGYSYYSGGGSDYATIAYSSAGAGIWTNRYNGPGNGYDYARAVAVDGSGNIYVTGASGGSGNNDFATIAYSSAGTGMWTNRYNGSGFSDDGAEAMAVDGSGNVYVTGYSVGSGGYPDYATIAYSSAGVGIWTNRYNGPGNSDDRAKAVALDVNGNVYVTGYSYGGVGYSDYATVAYSGAGVPLWTNRYNGPANYTDEGQAVAVDGSGNVYVTGYSTGSGGRPDYATIAYSSAGAGMWTNRFNGPGDSNDEATAVAVDGSGNVFVTGFSADINFSFDCATIKYSGAGVPLWTNRYNGPGNFNGYAQALAVDGSGNLFVTGYSYYSSGNYDYATVAYSGSGVQLWANHYNGLGNDGDLANAVAVDASGNVFVTGNSYYNGYSDYTTVAYSGAGVPLWTNRYNGPGNNEDQAAGLAVDGSGNIFVTGSSFYDYHGYPSHPDYVTVGYSGAGVPLWTNLYTGPENSDDLAAAVAVDGSGNVFVSGRSWSGTSDDYATVAYSGAGVPLWTNLYSGLANGGDYATAVAVDGSGNVFVSGYSSNGTNSDYATVAYSGEGLPLWTNRYNGPDNSGDGAYALAVDGAGNVFVTGYSYDGSSAYDYATVAYSGAGVPLWTNRYNGPGNSYDYANAVAVDASGNVFVSGYSYSGTNNDYATVAYSGAGVPLWTNRYNGPANGDDLVQTKYSLAIAPDGVVVVGSSDTAPSPSVTVYDFAVVKYLTIAPTSAPQVISQPQNVTLGCGSGPASFSVNASGEEPLSYQWYLNNALISGATATNYIVSVATPTNAGAYNVIVTNIHGAVTSSVATLTLTNQTPTVIAADAFSLSSGGTLMISPSGLTGNDSAGACAGSATELMFLSFSPTSANGGILTWIPGGEPLWTNRYNGLGNANDQANAVAVDALDNVFVTGTVRSTASSSSRDFITVAYSGAGSPLWTNRYNGPIGLIDEGKAIALGADGNVYVAGNSSGPPSGQADFAVIAYSAIGTPLWTNRYNGPGNSDDQADAVAVTSNGIVVVAGDSTASGGLYDFATVAYSALGVPLWTNHFNGAANNIDRVTAMAVDEMGNVFVTGNSYNGSSYDFVTVTYTETGQPMWTNYYEGPGGKDDYPRAVAVDDDGNVFVTGYSPATALSGSEDYATIKYANNGMPLWTNRYDGPANGADFPWSMAVDGSGNVFVTGGSTGFGTPYDYATVAYTGDGIPMWTNHYDGGGYDEANAVTVDASGNVIVTGYSSDVSSGNDFVTVAYSSAGVPLWTNRYNGPGNSHDLASAMTVDANGNVIVTGRSIGVGSGEDFVTVAYSGSRLSYTPTNGFTGVDTFTYVMQDGYGLTYTGTVSVAVGVVANTIATEVLPGGEVQLGFYGTPGQPYALERVFDLSLGDWTPQQTNTAAANGALSFTNLPVGTANFWRIRSLP